jgi:hypothetical protein
MIELGPATEDEMVLAFLRAEVESSRFGGRYPSHFAQFGQFGFDRGVLIDALIFAPINRTLFGGGFWQPRGDTVLVLTFSRAFLTMLRGDEWHCNRRTFGG